MKTEIPLPKNFIYTIVAVFLVTTISMAFFVYESYSKNLDEKKSLSRRAFSGTIVSMKNLERGNYDVQVKSNGETLHIDSWQIAWEVEKFDLQVGDSVRKLATNTDVAFYKSIRGQFKEICVCKLY